MNTLTAHEYWYGRDEPPPEIVKLRAGHLTLEFQEGDLRYIRFHNQEVIRRIYVAIRDVNWNTIPARMSSLVIDAASDRFRVEFDAYHQEAALAFRWHASIEGKADGTIEYTMDGTAESDFRYCRIGFCILHPVEEIAGSPYRAITPQGAISGVLSRTIEPQRMENGLEAPIFPACSSLSIDTPGGTTISTVFEGDLFEMEDQRNWTDASFKTYCTPLSLGYPHQATANQTFRQKVTLSVTPSATIQQAAPAEVAPVVSFAVGSVTDQSLPRIGFGMPAHEFAMQPRDIELLYRLKPAHLKTELHFRDSGWSDRLDAAIHAAKQLETSLELAVFLTGAEEAPLKTLQGKLRNVPVARMIIFHEDEAPSGTTSPQWMALARRHLPDLPLWGGTNGNFAELNRQPPEISAMDGVSYTINPQVHAWDERSLIENIAAQHDTVITARTYCSTLPIGVSSVTLKPPFNQAATEEEAAADPDRLPAAVDARQMSLFAAAWTVGSLHSLASAGVSSITYYETTGWRGLIETMQSSPMPDKFRSLPGMIFPVYWVFAFLADTSQSALIETRSSNPLLVDGLACRKGNRTCILLANLQPHPQEVQVQSLPAGTVRLWHVNEHTTTAASTDPDGYLKQAETVSIQSGRANLMLEAYETVFMELHLA